ncbi:PLP-dependent aminotransferase family protein [Companilactobacillus mishanensis]|uniref:PLP-dependent aminotransferase family protein n=1 Tax=Companilactobacillus mishanensis TaxID=2486008 RepID=A0ABW9P9B1_9LACO|nr:PLP-dependent aminotransferase family protein [Companilactobacillus mishanensis]MQS45808.1 PLP-dependent aminotransferase family protein [Companilactobacillus mishanensis]
MKQISAIDIEWKPNKDSNVPMYRQIVKFVSDKVASGEWPIGTRLPSQRELSAIFEVNRSTVTTAIDELTSYGIVSGRHGAGTQISSNTWSLLLPDNSEWNSYLSSGFFQENKAIVQSINRLEFTENVIRIGTGEIDPRLFPRDMWKDILLKVSNRLTSLGYLENLGLSELRQAISNHLEKFGIYASPDNILITSGSLQALQLISVSLLKHGSTVYTEAPSYLKSLEMFQSAGMKLSGVPIDHQGLEYWKLSRNQDEHNALYTIPTNHNPTGITMSEDRRQDLMKYCNDNGLPIIEDGAYQELCYDGESPTTLKSLDENGMVIHLGTASKTLAPGLRIGWVVADKPIVDRLGDIKMQMDYGASSLSQWAMAEFLNSGVYDEYVDDLRKILKKRRDAALDNLTKYFSDIATWKKPTGGFYIWLTFNKKIKIEKLFEIAANAGILLNPGDIYDFKENRSLRLSFAYVSSSEFDQAIKRLSEIIKSKFL